MLQFLSGIFAFKKVFKLQNQKIFLYQDDRTLVIDEDSKSNRKRKFGAIGITLRKSRTSVIFHFLLRLESRLLIVDTTMQNITKRQPSRV